ncbi:unnamed protein product [Lasius platythorax]|uniref:Uncharacterized protein n=1 Tax=Lasius platythorax TaxID=488582 RepID=A0AAV2NYK8_9HYME
MKLNFTYIKCEEPDAKWPGECRENDALNGQITNAPVLCRPQKRVGGGLLVSWPRSGKGTEKEREGKKRKRQLSKESEKEKWSPMSRRRRHAAAGVSALSRQLHVREGLVLEADHR